MSTVEKRVRMAEETIRTKNLIINNRTYSIESLNIHHDFDFLHDQKVRQAAGTWHIRFKDSVAGDYVRYIDIDLSKHNEIFRLRINAIKDIQTGAYFGPAGEVYSEMIDKIGKSRAEKYLGVKISKSKTPLLYMETKERDSLAKIYQLPRYLSNASYESTSTNFSSMLEPLMFTKSFDWMTKNYNQKIVIALYFLMKYGKNEYPDNFFKQSTLKKYAQIYKEAKDLTLKKIKFDYNNNKKHKVFLVQALSILIKNKCIK